MAIFNVKHGLFRNIPEDIIPGTFLICEDENALYADLADEEDPDNLIGSFRLCLSKKKDIFIRKYFFWTTVIANIGGSYVSIKIKTSA